MIRSRTFWWLFGAFGLLLAGSLGLVGWLIQNRLEGHLIREFEQNLTINAQLVRDLVVRMPGESSPSAADVSELGKVTEARITLVAADGRVLADTAEDPAQMDNHLYRPEVRQAQLNVLGIAIRHSDTVQQSMMYVALRTDRQPVAFVRLALPLTAVEAELRWLKGVIWTTAGLTLAGALLISWYLASRMSEPLVVLAATARAVGAGEYGKRVSISAKGEVGTLADAFNEMSTACANHIEQMDTDRQRLLAIFRSMVEGVLVMDSEQRVQFSNEAAHQLLSLPNHGVAGHKLWQVVRNHQLSELVETLFSRDGAQQGEIEVPGSNPRILAVHGTRLPAAGQHGAVLVLHDITHLRKLEHVRRDFITNASHELKTPLAAIQATVETLLDGALQDTDHAVLFLERIRENVERLHRLVQDMLTLSRAESGGSALDIGPTPVEPAVKACVARADTRVQAKKLRLLLEPPPQPLTVLAECEALDDILDNLLDNAVKYTPEGGRITLRWFVEGERGVIQVEDSGVGIPENDLARIFERFYRVDRARSREVGGTGLGLSIVKHLVQNLRGSVSASSSVGLGSAFTVHLPLS
jgi:two-component system phosphate regulon sensor histidine kinase PhoR